jgi:hypothetical protein
MFFVPETTYRFVVQFFIILKNVNYEKKCWTKINLANLGTLKGNTSSGYLQSTNTVILHRFGLTG